MAIVAVDVFNAVPAGGTVYAGIDAEGWASGSATGSIASGVWTPGTNDQGYVTQASFDALPANEWVQVAGTEWSVLETLVTDGGFSPYATHDFGTDGTIRSTFYAWVGCADDGRRVWFPRGGGHVDSSVNGVWAFDLLKMAWEVQKAPSKYDASGAAWSAPYQSTGGGGSFTRYEDADGVLIDSDGLYWDRLPDDTPTSAHTYNGVWYDSTRGLVCTGRVSKWAYNRADGSWDRARWTWNGGAAQTFTINQEIHYSAAQDAIYGYPARSDIDNFSFGKCAGDSSAWVSVAACTGWVAQSSAMSSVRLDESRVLFLWSNTTERWGIFNMLTETWETDSGDPITDGKPQSSSAEMQAAIYIPTWGSSGQVIRRGTNGADNNAWWIFDIATKANVSYTPDGTVPSTCSWPGSKYRSVQGLGIAMLTNDAAGTNSARGVYVMRYE